MTVNTYTQLLIWILSLDLYDTDINGCYCLSVLSFGNSDHKDIFVHQVPTLSVVHYNKMTQFFC